MKLMEEFPNETPEELSARFAEMMRTGGAAPPPSMVPVDPQRQQRGRRLGGAAPAVPGQAPGGTRDDGDGAPRGQGPGDTRNAWNAHDDARDAGDSRNGRARRRGADANARNAVHGDGPPRHAVPRGRDDGRALGRRPAAAHEEGAGRDAGAGAETARARARRANPDATEAELDVLAHHVPQARSAKRPPAQRTMTPAEAYRRAAADVKRERPGLGDPEAVGRAALSKLQSPRAADRAETEAALEALRVAAAGVRQQKILLDLLEEFPDRPLEELAAEAAARLDAVARPPGAEPGVDADLIKELARRHPDKSPAEVAAVATRIAAERATRDRTAGSNAAAASLPKKKTPGWVGDERGVT